MLRLIKISIELQSKLPATSINVPDDAVDGSSTNDGPHGDGRNAHPTITLLFTIVSLCSNAPTIFTTICFDTHKPTESNDTKSNDCLVK